jgi:integrase/recombinase XerD
VDYEKKAWYIPFKHFYQDHFVKIISNKARINTTMISITNTSGLHIQRSSETHSPKLPDGFLDLLKQKRYSRSTIKIYSSYFSQYQEYFANDDLEQISTD